MQIRVEDFEIPGAFYLGRYVDPDNKLLMYDSKDLVTHGVVLGMTGSGKTGLCMTLLEEAAIDGVPAIIIDPKGDISNLALTFPSLRASDFDPWVDPDAARRKGLSRAEFAEATAEQWEKGLRDWGQDGARIQRLRDAVDIAIYTPGSDAGLQVSVLSSLSCPPQSVREDVELFADAIESTVTGLLTLAGIQADPIQSSEHVFLSSLLRHFWELSQDLDLPGIIRCLLQPPFQKVGVLDIDSIFSPAQRQSLAMQLNNLLAAPSFALWLEGEPLDLAAMLYTPEGKPRHCIFSIAHLNDSQRMFFVSMLLNRCVAWMRSQSGTTSLRALLYIDELFGYLPPTQNPPSKKPLMILLKQARAFGLGVLLATQNPVDLDYKALSNIGTWFLGRLQTERDKARVIEGIAEGEERKALDQLLSAMEKRVFLMRSIHRDAPALFQVRWALSYLKGPLTRPEIAQLVQKPPKVTAASAPLSEAKAASSPPLLPDGIEQVFLAPKPGLSGRDLVYAPAILCAAELGFSDRKLGLDTQRYVCELYPICGQRKLSLKNPLHYQSPLDGLLRKGLDGVCFQELPAFASKAAIYKQAERAFVQHLYADERIDLLRSDAFDVVSTPDESEAAFRARLSLLAREARDERIEELRRKYLKKAEQVKDRIQRAQDALDREKGQRTHAALGVVVDIGTTLLGSLLGGSSRSRSTSATRGASRAWQETQDVQRAEARVEDYEKELAVLEDELRHEIDEVQSTADVSQEKLQRLSVAPKKKDIHPELVALAWLPYERLGNGQLQAAWI